MKKYAILIVIMFCGLLGKSQTIDTTVTSITAVFIQPVKAQFTDSLMSNRLGVRVISDDLKSTANLYWELIKTDGTSSVIGNFSMTGDDYTQWCAASNPVPCNLWPFTVVAKAYNLTFVNPEEKK